MQLKNIAALLGLGLMSVNCCEDRHWRCDTFGNLGFCENGNPLNGKDAAFYQGRCEKTCGACTPETPAPTSAEATPSPSYYEICEDKRDDCDKFLANGFCENGNSIGSHDAEFYLDRCQKTCGIPLGTCLVNPNAPTFPPTLAPSTSPPTTAAPTTSAPLCEDTHLNCAEFAENGWCETGNPADPEKDAAFYQRRCELSCGVCQETPITDRSGTVEYWSCQDDHDNCQLFSERGFCENGRPERGLDADFYRERCGYSCNACDSCFDDPTAVCDASRCGELDAPPTWTDHHCPVTCGLCAQNPGVTVQPACTDDCGEAQSQYCDTGHPTDPVRDAEYYQDRCPATCGTCDPRADFARVELGDSVNIISMVSATGFYAAGLPAMAFVLDADRNVLLVGFDGQVEATGLQGIDIIATDGSQGVLVACRIGTCEFYTPEGQMGSTAVPSGLVGVTIVGGEINAFTADAIYTGDLEIDDASPDSSYYFKDFERLPLEESPDYQHFFAGQSITNVKYFPAIDQHIVTVGGRLLKSAHGCDAGVEQIRFVQLWSIEADVLSLIAADNDLFVISRGQGYLLHLSDGANHVVSVDVGSPDVYLEAALDWGENSVGASGGSIAPLSFQQPDSCEVLFSYAAATAAADCVNFGISSTCPCSDMHDDSISRFTDMAAACGSCEFGAAIISCEVATEVCNADASCRQCAASFDGCDSSLECEADTCPVDSPDVYPTVCAFATCDYTQPCADQTCDDTSSPTFNPTAFPTDETSSPTASPTPVPSGSPTPVPSESPSALPTASPSAIPSAFPTDETSSPTFGGSYGGSYDGPTHGGSYGGSYDVNCEQCVIDFADAGGCPCLLDDNCETLDSYVSEGCEPCGGGAYTYCSV